MSYTVLARKYRSQTFDDLVGQDAIATTLKNAILSGRVHHGYLFTGTRGVGKTSSARVLAKALNCLSHDAPTPTPCGTCESCRMVAEGEDLDVLEIDAASNTGVDNIRDLRGNANYRPARSRFKVYIIDEVHMLSTGAFNALLKTLEEPPGHVKFILATTDVQKVPATIVSRCQRFDFRAIAPAVIARHLTDILSREGIAAEEAVIHRVARLAAGSMRDALSLLDQLLSFGVDRLTREILDDLLPGAHHETTVRLVEHIAQQDAAGALRCVEEAVGAGQTLERVAELLVEHLRTLMVMKVCGADSDLVDVPVALRDQLVGQGAKFDAPTFVYMIGLAEELRRSVKTSVAARALLDAAVVRLAMATQFSDLGTLISRLEQGEPVRGAARPAPSRAAPVTPSTGPPQRPLDSTRPAVGPAGRTASADGASPVRLGAARSAAVPAKRSTASRPMDAADELLARSHPTVRRALELFDGTLAGVSRSAPPVAGSGRPAATSESAESSDVPRETDEGVDPPG